MHLAREISRRWCIKTLKKQKRNTEANVKEKKSHSPTNRRYCFMCLQGLAKFQNVLKLLFQKHKKEQPPSSWPIWQCVHYTEMGTYLRLFFSHIVSRSLGTTDSGDTWSYVVMRFIRSHLFNRSPAVNFTQTMGTFWFIPRESGRDRESQWSELSQAGTFFIIKKKLLLGLK